MEASSERKLTVISSFPLVNVGECPLQHFRVTHRSHRADEIQHAAAGGGGRRRRGRQRLRDSAAQTKNSAATATDPTQPPAAMHIVTTQ